MRRNKHTRPTEDQLAKRAHARLRQILGVVVLCNILLACGIGYVGYSLLHPKPSDTPNESLKTALGIKSDRETYDTVRSTKYSFSVFYNKQGFKPVAYRSDNSSQGYTEVRGKDALKADDYALVYLYDNTKSDADIALGGTARLGISTNIHDDFFAQRSKEYGPNLSQIDTVERFFKPVSGNINTYTELSRDTQRINGINYRHVTYRVTNTKYIATNSISEYYYTVQNGRPYMVSLLTSNDPNKEFVASLRGLIANISYGDKSQSDTYGVVNNNSRGKVSSTTSTTTANIPEALRGETALSIAAKNQPAVVRIAANSCATISLRLPSGQEYMKVDNACSASIGSGSIVSRDGYISTNGHVVTTTPSVMLVSGILMSGDKTLLQNYLQYLVDTYVVSADKLNATLDAASEGDPEAINAIVYSAEDIPRDRLVTSNKVDDYTVQLGNDPLRAKTSGSTIQLITSKTNVRAKYVAADFDPYNGKGGLQQLDQSTSSDVAILKMQGKNFPVVQLGSISGIKRGDLITAIGFPAFVDGGLDTKLRYTVPTVTQGYVRSTQDDAATNARKLVGSSTPIAAGNSGGPAFTNNGRMAGLNTYATPACSDDECFSSASYFRDVADYKALLASSKVRLQSDSPLSTVWTGAIDDFRAQRYSAALSKFKAAKEQYPALYLADTMIVQAKTLADAARRATIAKVGIVTLSIVLVVGLFYAARLIWHIRLHKQYLQPLPATPTPYAPQMPVAGSQPAYDAYAQPAPQPQPPVYATPPYPTPPVQATAALQPAPAAAYPQQVAQPQTPATQVPVAQPVAPQPTTAVDTAPIPIPQPTMEPQIIYPDSTPNDPPVQPPQ